MPVIVCPINLFSYETKVYVVDEETGARIYYTLPLSELAIHLPMICYNYNSNKIHLFGDEVYCLRLAAEIKEEKNLSFSDKPDLDIEVNKE